MLLISILVGLVVANVVQPGAGMHIDPASLDAKRRAVTEHRSQVAGLSDRAGDEPLLGESLLEQRTVLLLGLGALDIFFSAWALHVLRRRLGL